MPVLAHHGPDLPVDLLEAQAAGQLVVFAGAGVSVPAGLPDFRELVARVFKATNEVQEDFDITLFERHEYDRVLGLLEERLVPFQMRRAVVGLLSNPDGGTSSVHRNLLDIASFPGGVRLVTTNFDRLFLEAGGIQSEVASAPLLPVPRSTHWSGLVHLHGLINEGDPDGRNLVLTSADFGRAYLLDAWAARFVGELFRNFHVLFVGYGVNDPVMKYLLAALHAERARDQASFKSAFALAGIQGRKGEQRKQRDEWSSKGLVPIFYHSGWRHRRLYETLNAWAELSRKGLRTRQRWALKQADSPPENPREDEAQLMVWALAERSGSVARAFAERSPPPPIGWLRLLDQNDTSGDGWSLLDSPADADEELGIPLVDSGRRTSRPGRMSAVSRGLAGWLLKHLDKREFVDWALERGGVLHPDFRFMVRGTLRRDGGQLSTAYRTVWSYLASEVHAERRAVHQKNLILDKLISQSPSSSLATLEVVRQLTPVAKLRSRSPAWRRLFDETEESREGLVSVQIEPSVGRLSPAVNAMLFNTGEDDSLVLPLVDYSVELLRDCLHLLEHFDLADSTSDGSSSVIPSVSPHAQNRFMMEWSYLVALNRRAFEALDRFDKERAQLLVGAWCSQRFPVFQRLALHAATEGEHVSPDLGAEILLANNAEALWQRDVQRECLRFLRLAARRLSPSLLASLETEILEGPRASDHDECVDEDSFREISERLIWRRLSRLKVAGVPFSTMAAEVFERIGGAYSLAIADDFSDEFASWVGEVQDVEDARVDTWRTLFRSDRETSVEQLCDEARQGIWHEREWVTALQEMVSEEEDGEVDSLRVIIEALLQANSDFLRSVVVSLSYWMRKRSRLISGDLEAPFLSLWDRVVVISLDIDSPLDGNPLDRALNHSIGHLTEALLSRLWIRKPSRGSLFPLMTKNRLTLLASASSSAGLLARARLVAVLNSLFWVDSEWVAEYLLLCLEWRTSSEAQVLWRSYLWSPRYTPELVAAFKESFLESFEHLPSDSHELKNACRLLVFISFYSPSSLTQEEIKSVLRSLEAKDLSSSAGALVRLLEDAEEPTRDAFWRRSLVPWIEKHWPKRIKSKSSYTTEEFCRILALTRAEFPNALETFASMLTEIEGYSDVDCRIHDAGLATLHPSEVLRLLDLIVPVDIDASGPGSWTRLRDLLDEIKNTDEGLVMSSSYARLDQALIASEWSH